MHFGPSTKTDSLFELKHGVDILYFPFFVRTSKESAPNLWRGNNIRKIMVLVSTENIVQLQNRGHSSIPFFLGKSKITFLVGFKCRCFSNKKS